MSETLTRICNTNGPGGLDRYLIGLYEDLNVFNRTNPEVAEMNRGEPDPKRVSKLTKIAAQAVYMLDRFTSRFHKADAVQKKNNA